MKIDTKTINLLVGIGMGITTTLSLYISYDLIDTDPSAMGWAVLFLIPHLFISGFNVFGFQILLQKHSKWIRIVSSIAYLLLLQIASFQLGEIIIILITFLPFGILAVLLPLFEISQRTYRPLWLITWLINVIWCAPQILKL